MTDIEHEYVIYASFDRGPTEEIDEAIDERHAQAKVLQWEQEFKYQYHTYRVWWERKKD